MLTGDVIMLTFAVWIGITTNAPGMAIAVLEILFVGACALLLVSRRFKRFLSVVGAYLAVVGLGIILNLVFSGMWGVVVLYALCVNVFYRFPPAWSLPLAVVCILSLIATHGALRLLPVHHAGNPGILSFTLALACTFRWFGRARRCQY